MRKAKAKAKKAKNHKKHKKVEESKEVYTYCTRCKKEIKEEEHQILKEVVETHHESSVEAVFEPLVPFDS